MNRMLPIFSLLLSTAAYADLDISEYDYNEVHWSESLKGKRALLKQGALACVSPSLWEEAFVLILAGDYEAANNAYGRVCTVSQDEQLVVVLDELESSGHPKALVVVDGQRMWISKTSLNCCYSRGLPADSSPSNN